MVIIFYNRLYKNLQHYLVTKLFGELMNDKFKKISIFLFILTVICFICGFGFLLSAAITAPMCSPAGQYPVMGESVVTVDELADYFNQSGYEYPSEELAKGGADTIETFCQIYCEEAEAEDIRVEVAFTQAMKETGFLQFGGDVSVEQFNFAGIGTTGGGVPGNSYPDVRTGVRAQIQHLKAYATDEPLNQTCVDNRYEYVKKASAPYVQWLGQKENPEGAGWATGENYGYDIAGMLQHLLLKEQG